MVAQTEEGEAALGRPELFEQLGVVTTAVPNHDGPIAGLALNGQFLAWLLLADSVKPEARQALQALRDLGLGRQVLLTGDRQSVADSLAFEVPGLHIGYRGNGRIRVAGGGRRDDCSGVAQPQYLVGAG